MSKEFFLAFWAKYKANHRKMGFGAVNRLLRSPIFCFQMPKRSESVNMLFAFLCSVKNK